MYYLMPDGTKIWLIPKNTIADFSSGAAVYKIQVDFRTIVPSGNYVDNKTVIIPVPSGTADFINTFKTVKYSFFDSITEEAVWKLIVQYGAVSGGQIISDDGKVIK